MCTRDFFYFSHFLHHLGFLAFSVFFTKVYRGYHNFSFQTSIVEMKHMCWQKTGLKENLTSKKNVFREHFRIKKIIPAKEGKVIDFRLRPFFVENS